MSPAVVWRMYQPKDPGIDAWEEFLKTAGSAMAGEASILIISGVTQDGDTAYSCGSGIIRVISVKCTEWTYSVLYATQLSELDEVRVILIIVRGEVLSDSALEEACERFEHLSSTERVKYM